MKKIWIFGLLLAMAITVMLTACQPSQNWTPTVTNQAIDFELSDLDGQTVSLSGLRGRPVMVNFWATWCGPCNYEMPFIQAVSRKWPESDLVILTINIRESAAKVQQFMDANNYSFTVLLDSDGRVADSYRITGIPTTLFIDKEGIIQMKEIGAYADQAGLEADLISLMGE